MKYLKRQKCSTGQGTTLKKDWNYAKQMAFLKPGIAYGR